MGARGWLLCLLTAAAAAAPTGAAAGTVEGAVRLERARVKFDGAKSGKFVVVSLEREGEAPAVAPEASPRMMDQKGLVFIPHVMAVQTGGSVEFLNSDNDRHNVYFLHDETGETLDIGTWGPGVSVTHAFDAPGVYITLCTLHLEMAAYIVVFPHSRFLVTEIDEGTGRAPFAFADVPAGEYALRVWHKKLKQKPDPEPVVVTDAGATVRDAVLTKAKYAR